VDWLWVLVVAARAASPAPADQWATVLSRLDEVRAQAYATGDAALLDRVYVRGSGARAQDVAALTGYRRRGATVTGARLHLISCRVLAASTSRARLDVVDQLGPAEVVWTDGTTTALPHDQPSRRVVALVRTSGGWRVAAVSPRPSSRR
jgi:hypothetical protein